MKAGVVQRGSTGLPSKPDLPDAEYPFHDFEDCTKCLLAEAPSANRRAQSRVVSQLEDLAIEVVADGPRSSAEEPFRFRGGSTGVTSQAAASNFRHLEPPSAALLGFGDASSKG